MSKGDAKFQHNLKHNNGSSAYFLAVNKFPFTLILGQSCMLQGTTFSFLLLPLSGACMCARTHTHTHAHTQHINTSANFTWGTCTACNAMCRSTTQPVYSLTHSLVCEAHPYSCCPWTVRHTG